MHVDKSESFKATGPIILSQYKERTFESYKKFAKSNNDRKKEDMGIEFQYQWPRRLRRRSAAVCFLGLWVRIPPEEWMFVCCGCRMLSNRGLCNELIIRPEKSYRL
jgi:hypothetical protein